MKISPSFCVWSLRGHGSGDERIRCGVCPAGPEPGLCGSRPQACWLCFPCPASLSTLTVIPAVTAGPWAPRVRRVLLRVLIPSLALPSRGWGPRRPRWSSSWQSAGCGLRFQRVRLAPRLGPQPRVRPPLGVLGPRRVVLGYTCVRASAEHLGS